jgi:NAD(P)H-dependent FMN reductase
MEDQAGQSNSVRPKLQIIIASTRPGRVGLPVGQWVRDRAVEHGAFDVEVVDLAVLNLPFMDEPNHPRLRQYTHQHTREWSAKVDGADAFIFVTPEYNHGMNAPLKNAIDYLNIEWHYKPVGIVSYGGVSGGTRAAQMIKEVIAVLKLVALSEAVNIPFVQQFMSDENQFEPNEVTKKAMTLVLDELVRWEAALRPLRTPAPKTEGVKA